MPLFVITPMKLHAAPVPAVAITQTIRPCASCCSLLIYQFCIMHITPTQQSTPWFVLSALFALSAFFRMSRLYPGFGFAKPSFSGLLKPGFQSLLDIRMWCSDWKLMFK